MKYALINFEGCGFPIAQKLIEEGQDVVVGMVEDNKDVLTEAELIHFEKETSLEKKQRLSLYKNIVPHIPVEKLIQNLLKVKNPSDYFVFFESNYLFKYAEMLKDKGFHGNFPTQEDRTLEMDRSSAKEFVKKYYPHLKIPIVQQFNNIESAKEFLKTSKHVWVLKSQTDLIPTFVPSTNNHDLAKEQITDMLDNSKKLYEQSGFILEKKIQNFVEITPEKLYYNGVPLALTVLFENKFLGSGNISSQVGCAGDLAFPISMDCPINTVAFPPIVDELAKKHKGFFIWDASLLIDTDTNDVYFGEFCPNRPGYNSFFTELAQVSSVHKFFESLVAMKNPFTLGTVGVSLTMFNMLKDPDTQETLTGASIYYPETIEKHIWNYNVYKKTTSDVLRTVGYDYLLSPITASGKSIEEAVVKLYSYVRKFELAEVYYRPQFDFISMDYPTSILNRLQYCLERKLFTLPFPSPFQEESHQISSLPLLPHPPKPTLRPIEEKS